jgi:hypothetical protein
MENKEQPAMPHTPTRPWDNESANGFSGLTKREYFAGLAMQGYLSNSAESDMGINHIKKVIGVPNETEYSFQDHYPKYVAKVSLMYADELLKQLSAKPSGDDDGSK